MGVYNVYTSDMEGGRLYRYARLFETYTYAGVVTLCEGQALAERY